MFLAASYRVARAVALAANIHSTFKKTEKATPYSRHFAVFWEAVGLSIQIYDDFVNGTPWNCAVHSLNNCSWQPCLDSTLDYTLLCIVNHGMVHKSPEGRNYTS